MKKSHVQIQESKIVREARRSARQVARTTLQAHSRVLDDIARKAGFGTWSDFVAANPPAASVAENGNVFITITFPRKADKLVWIEDEDSMSEEEGTELIPALVEFADPISQKWIDNHSIRFEAVNETHARAIVGNLPLEYLANKQAVVRMDSAGITKKIEYDHPLTRISTASWDAINPAVPFDSYKNPDAIGVPGYDAWSLITLAFGDDMDRANDFANNVNIARRIPQEDRAIVISADGFSNRIHFDTLSGRATGTQVEAFIRQSRNSESTPKINSCLNIAVVIDKERTLYHVFGNSWHITGHQTPASRRHAYSPRNFQVHAWWADSQEDPIPTIIMGSPSINLDLDSLHPDDVRIASFMTRCRSLGETIASDPNFRSMEANHNRRLPLQIYDEGPSSYDPSKTSFMRTTAALEGLFATHIVYLDDESSSEPRTMKVPTGLNHKTAEECVKKAHPECVILNRVGSIKSAIMIAANAAAEDEYYADMRSQSPFLQAIARAEMPCVHTSCSGTVIFSRMTTEDQHVSCTNGHENVIVHKNNDHS